MSAEPWPDNFFNLTDLGVCSTCARTLTEDWGALIGYIGNSPPAAGSYTSTAVRSEAEKIFYIGSNFRGTAPNEGRLWLNKNADAYSGYTVDNSGIVTATVTVTTEATQEGPPEQVTICHKPGTPAEKTKTIPISALDGHLGHGDTMGPCDGEGAICPCAASGSALELHELYLEQEFDSGPGTFICSDDGRTQVGRLDCVDGGSCELVPALVVSAHNEPFNSCSYLVSGVNEEVPSGAEILVHHTGLHVSDAEIEACRADIRRLIEDLDCLITPQ